MGFPVRAEGSSPSVASAPSPSRIACAFARLQAEGTRGLIAYVTAGDPAPDRTVSLIRALERGGADLIELGVPFSDPIADGPVIQRASDRALKAGTTVQKVLELVRNLRDESDIPVVVFSYLNPILRYGFERFAEDAACAGADGALMDRSQYRGGWCVRLPDAAAWPRLHLPGHAGRPRPSGSPGSRATAPDSCILFRGRGSPA